jgi:hypothetical protein
VRFHLFFGTQSYYSYAFYPYQESGAHLPKSCLQIGGVGSLGAKTTIRSCIADALMLVTSRSGDALFYIEMDCGSEVLEPADPYPKSCLRDKISTYDAHISRGLFEDAAQHLGITPRVVQVLFVTTSAARQANLLKLGARYMAYPSMLVASTELVKSGSIAGPIWSSPIESQVPLLKHWRVRDES